MCFLITADSIVLSGVGTIGVHLLNVCIHSFQSELIGVCASGESFAKWISMSYVVKRLANAICVFGSIVFFDSFGPHLSYRIIGGALVTWGCLWYPIYYKLGIMPCQLNTWKGNTDATSVSETAKKSASSTVEKRHSDVICESNVVEKSAEPAGATSQADNGDLNGKGQGTRAANNDEVLLSV